MAELVFQVRLDRVSHSLTTARNARGWMAASGITVLASKERSRWISARRAARIRKSATRSKDVNGKTANVWKVKPSLKTHVSEISPKSAKRSLDALWTVQIVSKKVKVNNKMIPVQLVQKVESVSRLKDVLGMEKNA